MTIDEITKEEVKKLMLQNKDKETFRMDVEYIEIAYKMALENIGYGK